MLMTQRLRNLARVDLTPIEQLSIIQEGLGHIYILTRLLYLEHTVILAWLLVCLLVCLFISVEFSYVKKTTCFSVPNVIDFPRILRGLRVYGTLETCSK